MPLGAAASGFTEGILGGLQALSTIEQARRRESADRAGRLRVMMDAVNTVTKNPDALPTVRAALQPYGMDLDPGILADVEETRKAHGAISSFLASGDVETFSEAARSMPAIGKLAATNPTFLKLVESATEKAELGRTVRELSQRARESNVTPGSPEWNAFLRTEAFNNPRVAAFIKGQSHLMGPEFTANQSQEARDRAAAGTILDLYRRGRMDPDTARVELQRLPSGVGNAIISATPEFARSLYAAQAFGGVQGREQARATPYEDLVGGGRAPSDITAFAPGPESGAPSPGGMPELRWGPENFTLRSGPAMALLGGTMDVLPPGPLPTPAPRPVSPSAAAEASRRGAPARPTLADIEADRARTLATERAAGGAEGRREGGAPEAGTWTTVQTADGETMLMNSRTGELRRPSVPLKPKESGTGTWVQTQTADGRVVLRNTKTGELREPEQPLAPRPTPADRPRKFASMDQVLMAAREIPARAPKSPDEAKDPEQAARARAEIMATYQSQLNASLGDAGIAANSALRKAGWDQQAIRAAQGKTAKYLPTAAPTTTASVPGAPPASRPSIPASQPDQGTQDARRALRPPAQVTRDAAKAELRRLLQAGHSPQSAAEAMRQVGWPIR